MKISALYPNFNIISEVSCVLLRRSPRFNEKRAHMAQRVIFERLRRFASTKGTLWCIDTFVSFSLQTF